jgi:hypothetical protein
MKKRVSLIIVLSFFSLSHSAMAASQSEKDDAHAITANCQAEAVTAQCHSKKMGHGMGHCLRQYRAKQKAVNPSFSFSPSCEKAFVEGQQRHPYWTN